MKKKATDERKIWRGRKGQERERKEYVRQKRISE